MKKRVAVGSKQEHTAAVLETESGPARIHVIGDNPFRSEGLQKWLGSTVAVTGTWRARVLRVPPGDIEPLEIDAEIPHSCEPTPGAGEATTSSSPIASEPRGEE